MTTTESMARLSAGTGIFAVGEVVGGNELAHQLTTNELRKQSVGQ